MKKVVVASVLAVASVMLVQANPAIAQDQPGQITIKDPAEYNAYSSAQSLTDPKAKSAAIESFLTTYPQSVVKKQMLDQLLASYQQSGDLAKTAETADRILQDDPNNIRAIALSVYIKKSQASQKTDPEKQQLLDQASTLAQRGLTAPKPESMADADFAKLKQTTTPIFHAAIAAASMNKKDYKTAATEYTAELQSTPAELTSKPGPSLFDTFQLGNALVNEDPKDLLNGIWYLARAANFFPDPNKAQIDQAAQYWYKKYHGGIDGYDQLKAQAAASVTPPSGYTITPAPPPPSPQDLAKKAIADTPDLKTLALADKEFILANGTPEDAEKVWAVMKDVTAEVPGTVIAATADQIQLAVTDDAKASKTADFTINLKTPATTPPTVGTDIKVDGTFDSYTQKPAMIILRDGSLPAKKAAAAPVHHHSAARK